MTTLADLGYNEFGMSPLIGGAGSLISTQNVSSLSGSKIVGGRIASSDGKTFFDMDNEKRILISDDSGIPRIMIGKLD